MPKTAGQKLGSLLLPLYVLAALAGMVAGACAGAVLSGASAIQRALEPGLAAGWGAGGIGIIPVLVGLPVGAVMSLGPATGAVAGLFVQAWNAPFPSLKSQARAAAWGAGSASTLLAAAALFLDGALPVAILAVGAAYAIVSFLLASAITGRLLRYREPREAAATEAG
jgi:hypothetical protein